MSPASIDGRALHALMHAGMRALEANRDEINALNVFPVPDGDTGTNMLLTMRSALEVTGPKLTGHAALDAAALDRAVLLGARGNSGLILAQFFKGLTSGLNNAVALDGAGLARGLRRASDNAYASVPDPKEGTMLTVFRECADRAEAVAAVNTSLTVVLTAAAEQARDTTSRTPSMLDVLRQAGVVDSGGYGFTVMLEGALDAFTGRSDGASTYSPPDAIVDGKVLSGHVQAGFAAHVTEEAWGFCTSFAIEGVGLDLAAIREKVKSLGKSAVVAGDERAIKVHVHVLDPGGTLGYAASLGVVSNVEVKDMDEQARDQAAAWASPQAGPQERVAVAVVAVVAGEGMARVFMATGMGACSVISGGDTMNPSTAELVKAVEAANSDAVVLLPNNKNVVGTARQVQALTKKQVRVVPTRTMQAGIAALLGFSLDASLEANAAEMADAAKAVTAIAVSRSTRDVTLGGVSVRKGEFIAVEGDDIVAAAGRPGDVLVQAVVRHATRADVVTVYNGAGVSEDDAAGVAAEVRRRLPGVEVEVVRGGQPHHEYLASVE